MTTTSTPNAGKPTYLVTQRLLAGEELEGTAVSEEYGVNYSLLSYVKAQMKQAGYTFTERREAGGRLYQKIDTRPDELPNARKPGRPPKKAIDVPTPKTMDFGLFEIKLTNGKARV